MARRQYGRVGDHFNNKISTLRKNFGNELTKELIKIGESIVKDLKKFLNENWYKKYKPKDYNRTNSLKNAIWYSVEKKGGNPTIRIYFDKRRFITKKVNNGEGWQPHVSFDGNDFIKGLIDFLNGDAKSGGVSTNPRRMNDLQLISHAEDIVNEHVQKLVNQKIDVIIKKYL